MYLLRKGLGVACREGAVRGKGGLILPDLSGSRILISQGWEFPNYCPSSTPLISSRLFIARLNELFIGLLLLGSADNAAENFTSAMKVSCNNY